MRCDAMSLAASVLGAGMLMSGMALAQSGGGMVNRPNSAEIVRTPDISPDQREFRDNAFNGKIDRKKQPTQAEIIAEASGVLQKLKVSCTVDTARLVGKAPADKNGHEAKTFEVSCNSGLGYFVVSADNDDAFSCFAAEATRDKDVAAGREPGVVCALPSNVDSKVMATTMLSRSGTNCHVNKVRWIGLSARASTEYTEVACSEGGGYVLTSAVPGSQSAPTASTCIDAAKRGILCAMSPTGAPTVTLQTFKDELGRYKVSCSAGEGGIRHIGQEDKLKRHVVEFKCAEFPKGLVAFIPLSDSKAPFEAMDCTQAAKRGATCQLPR